MGLGMEYLLGSFPNTFPIRPAFGDSEPILLLWLPQDMETQFPLLWSLWSLADIIHDSGPSISWHLLSTWESRSMISWRPSQKFRWISCFLPLPIFSPGISAEFCGWQVNYQSRMMDFAKDSAETLTKLVQTLQCGGKLQGYKMQYILTLQFVR